MGNVPEGKSPGPDRLPNKLYRTLAMELAPFLAETLNEGARHGELHPTCLEGIISVLYKKKDRTDPRNYRPITLLNPFPDRIPSDGIRVLHASLTSL